MTDGHSIRKILIIRAANQAMAFSIPTLAAVLSFVTYGSTQDSFDPVSTHCTARLHMLTAQAVIFTSLALFNLLRQPLMFLPRALSTLTDAQTAVQRLDPVRPLQITCSLLLMLQIFAAETMDKTRPTNPQLDVALRLSNVTFRWASPVKAVAAGSEQETSDGMRSNASTAIEHAMPEGFTLDSLDLAVPRGTLVALVGRVGSGKSSLLQGVSSTQVQASERQIIGEMITSSGKVAYCQQTGKCDFAGPN
jgi:ATP-binding cassette subfamily C (CFTR/MRP) protein 1